ncbi:MAG: HPF/RaiA family ribosome-associated protein [Gammaproteobacteria bacterium]|nr:HPF/RaiA family ribosome-associated protein [Gammaproteobacteria bacterium]
MQVPLQITFRNMEPSDTVEARIRERVERLEQLTDDIISCRVVFESRHQHQHHGNLFQIRIDLKLPGTELVSSRSPDAHHAHEDPYVAIRDAFDAMRRQLEDHTRKRRGKVKTHEAPPHGRIASLQPQHGMIDASDGRQVYFHRNSVVDADFDKLEVGAEVWFAEVAGEQGPQASTVHVVGKHHIVG